MIQRRSFQRFRGVFLAGVAMMLVAGPGPATATVTPIVRLTLSATPNPNSNSSSAGPLVFSISITPTNGTVPSVSVDIEGHPVTACTPAPNCTISGAGVPTWTFTNVSSRVTATATSTGGGGEDVRLYVTGGAGCTGACPAKVHMVAPVVGLRLGYTGPNPVVSGSVLHFKLTGTADAWPMDTLLQAQLPATGLSAPASINPGTATWDPVAHRIESAQTMNKTATLTFDTTVTAANGSVLTVIANSYPSSAVAVQRTLKIAVGSQVPPSPTIERLAGSDRYGTSAAISAGTFGPQTFVAYVATGANYPDALVAGPAAFELGGPVLLVSQNAIPASVKTELARIRPARIYVLGGTATISQSVQNQLASYSSNSVQRDAGSDRYATGAMVVGDAFSGYTGPVFLATGANFPDALSGGPAAAQLVAPIVLSTRDALPSSSLNALADMTPTKFILLGGASVLSSLLVSQLASRFPGITVERWSGADRYATSAAISTKAFPHGAQAVFLAIGTNYPDALSGGPAAAYAPGPILLTTATCMPAPVYVEFHRLAPARVVLLGGPSVLSPTAATTECAA